MCRATSQQLQAHYGAPVRCPRCGDVEASPKSASAWDWASDHDERKEQHESLVVDSHEGAASRSLAVPILSAFGGRVLGFQETDKGADVLFAGTTIAEVHKLATNFLAARGFEPESGTPERSTWTRGSAAGRLVAGGFVGRAKFTVIITQTADGVQLSFQSGMSGWSGSLVGVARERSQRKDFVDRLQSHINSLAVAPAIAPPTISSEDDPGAALERLRDLRDRALLSEEEYQAKRSQIVDRL